jgi:hypothetical protein
MGAFAPFSCLFDKIDKSILKHDSLKASVLSY